MGEHTKKQKPTRKAILASCALGACLAASVAAVQLSAANATTAPFGSAANVAPDLSDPYGALFDGESLNKAVWANFQLSVKACMNDAGWEYTPVPVPADRYWVETLPEGGTFDAVTGTTGAEVFTPKRIGAPSSIVANSASAYLFDLRASTATKNADYAAHDGLNNSKFGSYPEDTGGCEAAGRTAVTEPAREAVKDLLPELADLTEQLTGSESFSVAEADWANCMKTKDEFFDSIEAPADHYVQKSHLLISAGASQAEFDGLRADEQKTAIAAEQCVQTTTFAQEAARINDLWENFTVEHRDALNLAGGMAGGQQ